MRQHKNTCETYKCKTYKGKVGVEPKKNKELPNWPQKRLKRHEATTLESFTSNIWGEQTVLGCDVVLPLE